MKAGKILLGILAVVVVIIGGGVAYVAPLDFNSYKGEIQEEVKKAVSKAMVIDSDRVIVAGEGTIKWSAQELGLKLMPKLNNTSLINLSVSLLITGAARDPSVLPDPLGMAKGVGAIVLAGINPLTLALPFLNAGNADVSCLAAIAIAEGWRVPKAVRKATPVSCGAAAAEQAKSRSSSEGCLTV